MNESLHPNNNKANILLKEINARFDGDAHQRAAKAGKTEEDMVKGILDHLATSGFSYTEADVLEALQKAQDVHIHLGKIGRLTREQVENANNTGLNFLKIYLSRGK
jgi:hypothetical protein